MKNKMNIRSIWIDFRPKLLTGLIMGSSMVLLTPIGSTVYATHLSGNAKICSKTANLVLRSCWEEAREERTAREASCLNYADEEKYQECRQEASEENRENRNLCWEQRSARLDLCDAVGEAPYDPDWDPEDFEEDPTDLDMPNPYFPLIPGTQWVYEGDEERITVTVKSETKLIKTDEESEEGVNCLVVNDLVEEIEEWADEGDALEDTDDWYGQDLEGNIWYCGEISLNYELFEGDEPEEPELVDLDGSWKAFRDDAKPGILMPATPAVGDIYRQEVLLTEAEDVAEVVDIHADGFIGDDECENEFEAADLDALFALCNGNCLVTNEYTPIEPGVFEHKYYAPGVGMILEVDQEEHSCVALVEKTDP